MVNQPPRWGIYHGDRQKDPFQLARTLEQLVTEALARTAAIKQADPYTSAWRAAIEETNQDLHDHPFGLLVDSLRDTLEIGLRQGTPEVLSLVERYSKDPHYILRRLALHCVRSFPDQYRLEIQRWLIEPISYDEWELHHEFFLLLRDQFASLDSADQARVIGIILEGPEPARVVRLAACGESRGQGSHSDTTLVPWQWERRSDGDKRICGWPAAS